MATCNQLVLKTLESQLIMPKNLLGHRPSGKVLGSKALLSTNKIARLRSFFGVGP